MRKSDRAADRGEETAETERIGFISIKEEPDSGSARARLQSGGHVRPIELLNPSLRVKNSTKSVSGQPVVSPAVFSESL